MLKFWALGTALAICGEKIRRFNEEDLLEARRAGRIYEMKQAATNMMVGKAGFWIGVILLSCLIWYTVLTFKFP